MLHISRKFSYRALYHVSANCHHPCPHAWRELDCSLWPPSHLPGPLLPPPPALGSRRLPVRRHQPGALARRFSQWAAPAGCWRGRLRYLFPQSPFCRSPLAGCHCSSQGRSLYSSFFQGLVAAPSPPPTRPRDAVTGPRVPL